jgi:hypothetical protein
VAGARDYARTCLSSGPRAPSPSPSRPTSSASWTTASDYVRAYGATVDGRLFRGARGVILSESTYGRAWRTARAAALGPALAATQLARRPYDLRHAGLSLWVAAGVAPEEAAARAGNSLTVLPAVYAHPVPGQEKAANTLIDRTLHPPQSPASHYRRPAPGARGPRLAPKTPPRAARTCPPCVRVTAGPSWTPPDPDTIPPPATAPLTCEDMTSTVPGTAGERSHAACRRPRPCRPLTCPDLAHGHRQRSPGPLPDTQKTGPQGTSAPGLTWGFTWQVQGSNLRRLSPIPGT